MQAVHGIGPKLAITLFDEHQVSAPGQLAGNAAAYALLDTAAKLVVDRRLW